MGPKLICAFADPSCQGLNTHSAVGNELLTYGGVIKGANQRDSQTPGSLPLLSRKTSGILEALEL